MYIYCIYTHTPEPSTAEPKPKKLPLSARFIINKNGNQPNPPIPPILLTFSQAQRQARCQQRPRTTCSRQGRQCGRQGPTAEARSQNPLGTQRVCQLTPQQLGGGIASKVKNVGLKKISKPGVQQGI